jgi:two-component system response regulator
LILLDIKMPVMSGFEFLAWLRQQDRFRELPVLMLSSSDDPRDMARAKELGANGYLVKFVGFIGVANAITETLD